LARRALPIRNSIWHDDGTSKSSELIYDRFGHFQYQLDKIFERACRVPGRTMGLAAAKARRARLNSGINRIPLRRGYVLPAAYVSANPNPGENRLRTVEAT